jgi:hypothetical protein
MSCLKNYGTAFHVSVGSAGELLIPIGPLDSKDFGLQEPYFCKLPSNIHINSNSSECNEHYNMLCPFTNIYKV